LKATLEELAPETADYLGLRLSFDSDDYIIKDDYLGAGYGVLGDRERVAIGLVARTEGILLDPVYTGRAMAGLLDLIRKRAFGPEETIVFWHTGGTSALFAYSDELLGGAR
jgi:1-aminocyclopropane-1-carboxylate deaminase/D-cysteine desulfhydrase-like pyridoxal-dependent ACC family enzyme